MIFKLIRNFQPGPTQIKADLKTMNTELSDQIENLVPWDRENLELLSFNLVDEKVDKGLITTGKGLYTSIYHEPLLAVNYKKYISKKTNAILYAATSKVEFIYRILKHQIEVHINRQLVGTIKKESLLYSAKSKRLIARINQDKNKSGYFPVIYKDRELGSVANPDFLLKHNPRVFEFVKESINPTEEAVLLTFGILKMVDFKLPDLPLD